MKKYTVVFTVRRFNGVCHYQGIIFLDGKNIYQFGRILADYSAFVNWYQEKCKDHAAGEEFRAFDQQIRHEEIKEDYCYGN